MGLTHMSEASERGGAHHWCALQRALGHEVSSDWRCNSSVASKHERWIRSASERSRARAAQGFSQGCESLVCELSIVGICTRSRRMSGTAEQPQTLQVTDTGDAATKRQLCQRRLQAWRMTCGAGAQITVRLAPIKLAGCASGGSAPTKGNARLATQQQQQQQRQRRHTSPQVGDRSNGVRTNLPAFFVPAKVPDGYPFYRPGTCNTHATSLAVPRVLWQTGRGNSAQEHNNATAAASQLAASLLGDGLRHVWHNDSAARDFVARRCPEALAAYDCLRPNAFRADLWRYCVLFAEGGFYMDAEDVPLVPLQSFVRPCDSLVLANDLCPDFSDARKKAAKRGALRPCNFTSVQISFMAAVAGLPFFRCAIDRVIAHVQRRYYGPGDLFVTGPPVAGHCLAKLHARMEYTMELTQGNAALMLESTPVVRTHLMGQARADLDNPARYNRLWASREIYAPGCAI